MKLERILLIVVTFVLIVFVFKHCSRPSEEKEAEQEKAHETEIAILKVERATVQLRQDSLAKVYKSKGKTDSLNLALQDSKIQALQTKLTNQRPKVIERIQADTAVLSYVNTLEEVVTELQIKVDTLLQQKEFQRKLYSDLVLAEIIEDKNDMQTGVEYARRVAELEKSNKRKERGKRFAKILLPVAAVGAFLLGASL